METSTPPSVRCEQLVRRYGAERGILSRGEARSVTALSGVSLQVAPGEVVGISGPSGSGKSTLLHLLAGLDSPTAGRIRIEETDLETLPSRRRARFRLDHVGLVFQRFYLLPALTARQNVSVPLLAQGRKSGFRRERATKLLEDVGLGDRTDHRPGELSGGEQQRVAIARALATDPTLLLADEPTGELDRKTGTRVLDTLTSVNEDRAVVVASHDSRVLERTDRVVRLRDGERVE